MYGLWSILRATPVTDATGFPKCSKLLLDTVGKGQIPDNVLWLSCVFILVKHFKKDMSNHIVQEGICTLFFIFGYPSCNGNQLVL